MCHYDRSVHASDLTAAQAKKQMADGELSAVELVRACRERTDAVDPVVNAMVIRCDDRAEAEAQAADAARVASDGSPLGPLHGLPIAIKDLQPTAGIRTTYGSPDLADNIPTEDAGIVARVRAAGGIVVGKTNLPEYSIGANTVNPLFGATGNPFDPELTCGGSSGGSGVAVATGMVPLATGSDHGGSLRIPASYCGVVAHRATPGIVPNEQRTMAQNFYSVQGPMARTVRDAALLLSVVASRDLVPGRRPRDAMTFPFNASSLADLVDIDLTEIRIGVTPDLGGVLVSESVRSTFASRVERLAGHGLNIVEVPVDLRRAPDVDWRLRADIFVTQWGGEAATWTDDFNPNIRQSFDAALAMPMEEIAAARRTQTQLLQDFAAHFDAASSGVDVILCPGVSVSPFPWVHPNPVEIDGHPVENYMAWLALTASLTVVGHPVTALPCGTDDNGLPFGLQIAGPMYSDRRVLSIAAALEDLFATDEMLARPVPPNPPVRR